MGVSLNKDDGQRHTLINNHAVAKEHAMSDAKVNAVTETLFATATPVANNIRVSEKRDPIAVPECHMAWYRVAARNQLSEGEHMAKLIEVIRQPDGTVIDAAPRHVGDAMIRTEMVVLEDDFRAAVGNLIEVAVDKAWLDRLPYVGQKGKSRTLRIGGEIASHEACRKVQKAMEIEAYIAKNPAEYAAFKRLAALKAAAKPATTTPAPEDAEPIL